MAHFNRERFLKRVVHANSSGEQKQHVISNISRFMKGISLTKKNLVIRRQLCHFFRADSSLDLDVVQNLVL